MDVTRLIGLASGHAEARAIQTALKLGLFESLRDGPHDAESLARAIGCERRATSLLANAMVALNLLAGNAAGYRLIDETRRWLLESSPEYLGGMILFDEALWATWGQLDQSVRRGQAARATDMYQSEPAETARFIRAMDSLVRARGDAQWMAEHLDLSFARTIGDVGGGPGTYLVEFVRRWPALRGLLFDLPATLEVSRRLLKRSAATLMDRIELRELDYQRGQISGPLDVIFMSNIIHSEDEAANAALLAKCFGALAPGGLLIIKDHLMNPDLTEPVAGAVFSLYLLLTTHGRDYSFDEVARWLHGAGFKSIHAETLPCPPFTSSMVLARKP